MEHEMEGAQRIQFHVHKSETTNSLPQHTQSLALEDI